MRALALTHAQLRAVASVTAFASRSDVTPTITGVQLELTDGRIIATATDRYRVAELSFPAPGTDEAFSDAEIPGIEPWEPITIPAAFLARAVKALPRHPVVPGATLAVIMFDEGHRFTVRDRIAGLELTDGPVPGNFPPVARLFPENLNALEPYAGQIGLKAAFLASLEKLALPTDASARSLEKVYGMRTQTPRDTYSKNKPAPVIFTRSNGLEGLESIRVLIQPNLITR